MRHFITIIQSKNFTIELVFNAKQTKAISKTKIWWNHKIKFFDSSTSPIFGKKKSVVNMKKKLKSNLME